MRIFHHPRNCSLHWHHVAVVIVGEFIELGTAGFSFELISGMFCAAALGIYALVQPDSSDDDDSNGGGGGGLMQPIA